MLKLGHGIALGWLLVAGSGDAWAQGIYTCIDSKGRRITSDRPIVDCLDRPQHELNPSGSVRRTLPPSLTAEERAAAEEKARKAAEEKQREDEEKRRNRALVTRYPDQPAHDRERAAAVRLVDEAVVTAQKRASEQDAQHKKLAAELEFYKGDMSKVPPRLKKQLEDSLQQVAAQKRFLAEREEERKRLHARFDEELAKLKELWGQQGRPALASASAPAAAGKP